MSGRRTQATDKDEQPQADAAVADRNAEQPIDETIPGGRFIDERGRMVNANGEEITKDGKVKKADD